MCGLPQKELSSTYKNAKFRKPQHNVKKLWIPGAVSNLLSDKFALASRWQTCWRAYLAHRQRLKVLTNVPVVLTDACVWFDLGLSFSFSSGMGRSYVELCKPALK